MQHSTKLLYVLQSLSKVELNRFSRYLHSPYLNQQEAPRQLFELLLPMLKSESKEYPDRRELYKKLFKKPFNDIKWRRVQSDLLALAEGFLALELHKHSETKQSIETLTAINGRGLTKLFNTNYEQAIRQQARVESHDAEYYLTEFQLHVELNQHIELQKKRTERKNLEQVMDSLDTFYLINKLRYACAIEHYRNVLKIDTKVEMIEEVLNLAATAPFQSIAVIVIYEAVYYMLSASDGEVYFEKLKAQLQNKADTLSSAVERDAYIFAINFCVKQINKGKLNYLREVFELYNIALEKDLLFDKNELSPWDYKNLVTLGLRLKENKWTETFIAEYKNKIPLADRSNAYTFNLAKFYFYTRAYDEVLRLLQGVKYDDLFYLLDSKTLLAKTYYELGENEPLYSLISSFRALLRRKRNISDTHRKNYSNLLYFISQLTRVDVRDKRALEELKKEFESSSQIADAGWLREKFAELGVGFENI